MSKSFPKPRGVVEPGSDRITNKDVAHILDSELHPVHRDDPVVLRFINAYLTTRDLGDAAKEAGIDKRSARVLRQRSDIHSAIKKITDAAVLKYGLDPDEIVEKVKGIAYFDPADLFNLDGSVKRNIHTISSEARRAIKSIKHKTLYGKDINGVREEKGYITEFTFWDKNKALEHLGREKSLFKETIKQEFDVTENMKEVLLESRDRAAERMERLREKEVKDVSDRSKALPASRDNSQRYWGENDTRDTIEAQSTSHPSNEVGVGGGPDKVDGQSSGDK